MSRRFAILGKTMVPLAGAAFLMLAAAGPPVPTPSAEEIVARHVAARGGLKKILSIQTLRQKGRATAGAGRQALVTREVKRPHKIRFEFTTQGVTAVYASDGRQGWQVSPFEGDLNPEPMPDEALVEAFEQADIEGPLVDWKSKGHSLELVGLETVGGREAHKIRLTLKSGAVRYEYLDVKTLYQLRTETTRHVRGRPVQMVATFDDFRKTGGVVFPRLIDVGAAGRPGRLRIVVDKVEVNPPLSDARFQSPIPPKP